MKIKPTPRKAIYLAGKIHKNDWRHDAVRGLTRAWNNNPGPDGEPHWPTIRGGLAGAFDYVGPYFMSDNHGCGHGDNMHGCGADNEGMCGGGTPGRDTVRDLCLAAIDRADIVFAWLDDPTAHGTLVEIGYALGRNKHVIVAAPTLPPTFDSRGHTQFPPQGRMADLWFAFACATTTLVAGTPAQALATLTGPPAAQLESPIEERFWQAYLDLKPDALHGLQTQVRALDGRYRLDFALPDKKIGIELDGYAWHSSPDAFTRDRARQRELEADGWRIVRFSGSEITRDASGCVTQAAALAASFDRGEAS